MTDLFINNDDEADLNSILKRVRKPGNSFSLNGEMIGHVISLTEVERARLETLLLIAIS